jgi:hypothetical protein
MTTIYVKPQPLLDVLIAGLGIESQGLGSKCEAALRALGGGTAGYIRAAATGASPRRRKLLELFAATLDETQKVSPNAVRLAFDAVLCATGARTNGPNSALMAVLRRGGSKIVGRLISEAYLNRSKPTVCLRILEVVEQLGEPCDGDDWMDLQILSLATKNSAVRALANKLLSRLVPGHPPPHSIDIPSQAPTGRFGGSASKRRKDPAMAGEEL